MKILSGELVIGFYTSPLNCQGSGHNTNSPDNRYCFQNFTLKMSEYNAIIDLLQTYSFGKWHVHETALCRKLCIVGNDGVSASGQLRKTIGMLKRGGVGNFRKNTWVPTSIPAVDLTSLIEKKTPRSFLR